MEDMEEFAIPEEALEKLKDSSLLNQLIQEGKTFQEIVGYSDLVMDKFYVKARSLFEQQRYDEAAEAFVFLATLNPYTYSYWLGLGMSEQLCDQQASALAAYGMAILTDPTQPNSHYHSASCHKTMGNKEAALASLELALTCCEGKPEYDNWKTLSLKAKQLL
jgi:type III secretion system low calcium response chaperone LcrH/SycD